MIKSNKIRKNNKKNVILFYNNKENDFLSYKDGINMLKNSEMFRQTCTNTLKDIEYKKGIIFKIPINKYFMFEFKYFDFTKHYTKDSYQNTYDEKIDDNKDINNILSLSNTILLIPSYKKYNKDPYEYQHFLNFINNAPDVQIHQLWKDIGSLLTKYKSQCINTSGLEIPYLHVRLNKNNTTYCSW